MMVTMNYDSSGELADLIYQMLLELEKQKEKAEKKKEKEETLIQYIE